MSALTQPAIGTTGSPFKGLDHYAEQDAPFFFGRDVECDLVIANLLAARLTLLYGQSGVGKSSLLHAGVVPRLREAPDLAVVVFRSWSGDPVTGLATAIWAAAGLERPAGNSSIAETIGACTELLGRDLVVILDQFEEYFVYHSREDGDGTLAVEFPQAVNQRELPVSFLVSIREDALSWLDHFKGRIPNLFGNYLRIDRLDRGAGHAAIVLPLEEYGRRVAENERIEIEPPLVEAVLDQVRVGNIELGRAGAGVIDSPSARETRIEAAYLQLVLTRLWEEESAAGSRMLRLKTLDRLGGAQRIVPAHLDAAMAMLSREERNLAARVFRFLVTPSGSKIAHNAADLAEYARLRADQVGSLLDRLSGPQTRILRGVGDGRYEIYHDVLAPAILDWDSRRRAARLRRTVAYLSLILILFVGGVTGFQFTTPRSGLQIFVGWIIGTSASVALVLLIFSLGVRWGRIHP